MPSRYIAIYLRPSYEEYVLGPRPRGPYTPSALRDGEPRGFHIPRVIEADTAMTTDRRFCRFNRARDVTFGVTEFPESGICLSAFLILSEHGHPNRVLMGHLNPAAPWDHIGAMDATRVQVHSKGWMIPSSHLMLRESPQDAARRIAVEQLERPDLTFSEPQVVSEVYEPRRFPGVVGHWDLEFLFRGEWPPGRTPKAAAWTELRFVDLATTPKSAIARSHEDVLESAGLRFERP